MADRLRYVQLDAGGRPETLLDLDDQVTLLVVRDTFTANPATKQPVMSTADRRYGGSRQVAETTDNGTVAWTTFVAGTTADECVAKVEQLLARVEASPGGQLLEWRPDGATKSALYEVRGTATWSSKYRWVEFAGANLMVMDISVPVGPLARGLPMDILDSFTVDTRTDYTYDTGVSSNEEVAGGLLVCAANASTENRAIHTARGYTNGDNQQTLKCIPGSTITGLKYGVVLKRITTTTWVEVYIDDEGTNSRLRVDKIISGTRTNLATTNLASRVKASTAFWVRGRIVSNNVLAEHFTEQPTPMGTALTTAAWTFTGPEAEQFGAVMTGQPGRVWIPKSVGAACDEYSVEPYTYRNVELPSTINMAGAIPGDAPAKVDLTVTNGGSTTPPVHALAAWTPTPPNGLAPAPFGVLEGESGGGLSGWTVQVNGSARGAHMLLDTAASFTHIYTATWELDPAVMTRDMFTTEIAVEVWARVLMDSTLVTPSLTASLRPADGTAYGAERFTDEWGSAGKLLTKPGSGTGRFRPVRLGTLRMLVDPTRPRIWNLWVTGSLGVGSSGSFGIDYLVAVPINTRACSPSSKPNDATFPPFIAGTSETSKTVRSDLSARVSRPPAYGHPDHGLGGQLIEPSPGLTSLFVKLSNLVADDPTLDSTTEETAFHATVHAAVTPRWHLARSA